ncbi:MAG TPA: threonine/serine dehydratase [Chroococcales cyanobacterium]
MSITEKIDREQIARTEELIRPHIRRTPIIEVNGSDFDLGSFRLTFKLELMQHAGSFKTRGAFANLLMREIPEAGVVAASGGNHGAAVAYAARKLGVKAKIFVPSISSPAKIQRIRDYGAELAVGGDRYADALAASELWVKSSGALPVHAFDQEETLLGQGTIGLEFDEQTDTVDTLLVAVGGGGLIGGIASWYGHGHGHGHAHKKAVNGHERQNSERERKNVRVVGVEPEAAPTLTRALEAGEPVDAEAGGIAADSLAPRRIGSKMFPIAQKFVKQVVLVQDPFIRQAQEALWAVLRIVVEPGGAAPFAALLSGRYKVQPDEHVAVLLSGGNTVAVDFNR